MKVTHVLKDGTVMNQEEWTEYWKTHTIPIESNYYNVMAGIMRSRQKKENDLTDDPAKVTEKVVVKNNR